jgi:hypothetical protein
LTHFFWAWVGAMVNREVEDNCYSEEIRMGQKDVVGYSEEVNLLRIIEG